MTSVFESSFNPVSSVKPAGDSEGRKNLKRAGDTWRWVSRFNELDDLTQTERTYMRYGVVRGQIKHRGEVVKIDLHDCKLQGEMSANLFTMVSLRVLILFRNELNGGLPEGLGDLPCLEHIDLSHNTLTGPVPESLGRLINLRQLHLEFNQFAGPLPAVFTNLTSLERFTANNNLLSGPIPDLSQCVRLEELHLHENFFDGPIPESLRQCTRLKSLTLVKNCLEGALPEGLTSLLPLVTTPRSGVDLPCQILPQRTYEEVQQLYAAQGAAGGEGGWYDEEGRYMQAYYDEWGNYIQGYYNEGGEWVCTSYVAADTSAYNT